MEPSLFDHIPERNGLPYADVILPVSVPNLFTYRVPFELDSLMQPGIRVIVPFGRKVLTGVVARLHDNPPEHYKTRELFEVLDEDPMVTEQQLKLFQWTSSYYMCHMGEVLNAALPSGLKLSSQSRIQLHPEFSLEDSPYDFNEKEERLLKALKHHDTLSYADTEKILEVKSYHRILKTLIDKRAILLFEELKEKFKPKVVSKVRLSAQYVKDTSLLESLFEALEKKPKQTDVLLKYLQHVNIFHDPEQNQRGLDKSVLTNAGISASSLKTLINNQVMDAFEEVVSRFDDLPVIEDVSVTLSEAQQKAKSEIVAQFEEKDAVLLHGITGSGKTEIYIDLIQEVLQSGSQVLYLLPEIALTTQIVGRLRKVFGDKMGVFHSKYSDNERVEVWKGVLSGKFNFVIGVRSSVFLPFDNLGLIIIDEEHETSYKQHDPAPRYHARDLSLVMAHLHNAKTLLASATPSVESYYNARSGKYGLVSLEQRYGDAQLPELVLADVRRERKRKTMKGDFSSQLIELMNLAIANNDKTIIFQNRRGYAPYLTCEDCSWIPQCGSCAVSLTYHMYRNELRCHYCGHKEKVPVTCMACGSTKLKMIGFGTEKLEEDIKLMIPQAKVQRMDLDTTRRKYSYQKIIDDFSSGEIDVLVGTQMVSKGLDFEDVNLVGVVDADRMINFPDFRAHERAFQMITQVSGRAGRREKPGKVVIQTANVQQPILELVMNQDYFGMYRQEMLERKQYNYPPFVRLIRLSIRDKDQKRCAKSAMYLANILREDIGRERVLGPQEPLISRIRNQFRMEIMLKLPKNSQDLKTCKKLIHKGLFELMQQRDLKNSQVVIDVDPY